MKIAVFGTGTVGPAVAGALAKLGHDVVIGTRDPRATLARTEAGPMGGVPFAQWHAEHGEISLTTFAEAAAGSEIVVNATNGTGSLDALAAAGAANLAGKVIVDIANPLDFSQGFPPSLNPVNTDSLGEQIQRAFPDARVVKTLNTMNAGVMVDPASVAGGDHSVFVSGNDADAKSVVAGLLADLGHRDIIDLGDITTARGTEMLLPIWLRLWGAFGNADFNFKIAR
ncbi:NAD(P)-binding domain-containing protein [Arthrobacter sp. C9C5]|uniref:NADPH-dependent F420 reductase n=1 Tax=Arthrobacter sp. C9C5 TaxID=2735267 RepID=UPI00158531E5|nr:NAD(P)-binding domain-containing protein [Arthrobacter sp. C9C5]NUU31484.1 NAD(P)-binding domain-containing protein [Arthrobacter sp. C9C5]